MHLTAYLTLLISLLAAILLGVAAAWKFWQGTSGDKRFINWLENGHLVIFGLITGASIILMIALVTRDFSLEYVQSYTDVFLPMFYTVTAFWAGQAGSLLFWAWTVSLFGVAFQATKAYRSLAPATQTGYWLLFLTVMAFFLLMLTCWSNPFIELVPAPADGNGMNPLLQNPGMIFHPPLLFLGYAGFTIPACLALATVLSGEDITEWLPATRNFTLSAWLFLTSGIVLGAWWSYMELGWGGYWAWDPVENASLIPWLVGTGFVHTAVVESRRGALRRTNIFLIGMTLVSAFFATYLVRSGVIDSLHAFGDGGVGGPLLIFILAATAFVTGAAFILGPRESRELSGLVSREGFLFLTCWLLVALGIVIMLATLWPVISQIWSANSVGLDAGFYNRVCLPLFAVIGVFLMICPWLGWKDGVRHGRTIFIVGGMFFGIAAALFATGMTLPLAVLGAAAGFTAIAGIILLFILDPGTRRQRTSWAAYGVHIGLAMTIFGVAFSGPYQVDRDAVVMPGESVTINEYVFTYKGSSEGGTNAMAWLEAEIEVTKDGKPYGTLHPQRRVYRKFQQPFAEVSVIPGLGDELYATLLAGKRNGEATLKISIHPLVNWLWIGGTLMSLFPILGFTAYRRREAA